MNRARTVLDEYEDLTALILDGAACDAERARFNEIAREFPEFRSIWLEQVRLHALLVCRGGGAPAYGSMRTSSFAPLKRCRRNTG